MHTRSAARTHETVHDQRVILSCQAHTPCKRSDARHICKQTRRSNVCHTLLSTKTDRLFISQRKSIMANRQTMKGQEVIACIDAYMHLYCMTCQSDATLIFLSARRHASKHEMQ